ncbi:hypothetical protein BGW42_002560 [Actinomortierella wolfii]|nr:hypothetical protein BGW42_002560 [Actinomortierella wolfii]
MTEFRDHALQFTTLQIVGYGSQQVEVTQRISGYDLVNRGVKVYIDHRQVLYNNKSSYGFSIVLSNQPMSQLSTPPRPPTSISMLLPSAAMDDDPSLGGSLEVQLTSAYCRRNLSEMLRDTATTDTVIYVMNPCCSANSTSSTTSKTESSPITTSSMPQQQSPLHHAAPQQRFMQRPEHQQQVLASNITQNQQQHTENPQHHPLQHRHDVPQAQVPLTLPPTSVPNQSQSTSQVQQTIATAPGRNEHVTQSAPPESLQSEAARSEQQRSPNNSNSPTPLARPLTTPPPHDRSISPTPSESMTWSHYHSRQYAQHVQPHHPRHAIFAQRQYHSPSWPHPPQTTVLQAQSTQPLDQPHSNLEHETAPQAPQHKQPTPEQLLQKSSHQLTSEIRMEFRAHYVVLKNYSMINRMIQRAASEQQRLRYVMCIRLQNPHLMRVLLEYLYTHQITAPTLLNSKTPSSSFSPSAPTRPSSPPPTLRQYTYTWRELYELAEQFGLHTLARMVKCALIAELTPDTVQEQLLEWVYLYPSLFPAYVKYAVDHRVDLLNSLQDMQIETEVDDDIHNLTNIAGADENRNMNSGSRRTGGSNTDQWRRERTRRTAAAETYFRHTPSSSTAPGTSVSSAENDVTSRATSSSLAWSHPKYRNVVARYTMFLDGIFALPTGFESKC